MQDFIKQLGAFMREENQPCPIQNRPPKDGVRVHTIPKKQRPLWALAAALARAGFKEEGENLTNILARQAVARIEAGFLYATSPEYVFCNDWCVYRKAEKRSGARGRHGGF